MKKQMRILSIGFVVVSSMDAMDLGFPNDDPTVYNENYFSATYAPEHGEQFQKYIDELIAQKKDLNQVKHDDDSLLIVAINLAKEYDMHAVINKLIDYGIDLNLDNDSKMHLDNESEMPLTAAIISDAPFSIVKLLLDRGADVNKQSQACEYPLEYACWFGRIPIVELFLQYGAHPEHGLRTLNYEGYIENIKEVYDETKHIAIAKRICVYDAHAHREADSRKKIVGEARTIGWLRLATFIEKFQVIRKQLFDAIDALDLTTVKSLVKEFGYTGWYDEQGNTMVERGLMAKVLQQDLVDPLKRAEFMHKKDALLALVIKCEPCQLTTRGKIPFVCAAVYCQSFLKSCMQLIKSDLEKYKS